MNKFFSGSIRILRRLGFVLLTSTVLVFFSEKAFWYVQGYPFGGLILYYALPTAACLWLIHVFRVQNIPGMILVSALFGILVEGVLTPVIYEGGLWDPFMPAYFIGWHGLLSFVFGWYWIRRQLVERRWRRLILGGLLFGIFWGLWSLTFQLPESIQEYQLLVQAGENWIPGPWTWEAFAVYCFTFTGMLMAAHWLLGKIFWQEQFPLAPWEIALLIGLLGFVFTAQVLLFMPLAVLKLLVMITVILIPLEINRRKQPAGASILQTLAGQFTFLHTLPLLIIPAAAVLVYGLAVLFPPGDPFLRDIQELTPAFQALIGAGMYLWAFWKLIFRPSNLGG